MRPLLMVIYAGTLDPARLDRLRQALGMEPQGDLDNRDDVFGTARLDGPGGLRG